MTPEFREAEVERALIRIQAGEPPADVESETLDCKEDPSRRAPDGAVTSGDARSEAAGYLIAEFVRVWRITKAER